jgi:RNA polymerase sigma-70 factor, ECF subfamily
MEPFAASVVIRNEMPDERSDAELMARARGGDHDAFAAVVERHKDALVAYLTHLTGTREAAEEVAQEALVRLYRAAGSYDERGKLAPYLFRIATNLVRSQQRRARRWDAILFALPVRTSSDESPQALLLGAEIQKKVAAALTQLPVACRAAVVLREIEGWSYDEIARALGCREGTVKSRIARGREMLRKKLSLYWNGSPCHEPRLAE